MPSYSQAMVMLPRLLSKEEAADYVGGEVMLETLAVKPVVKRKGLVRYDRQALDRAIDGLDSEMQAAADLVRKKSGDKERTEEGA